jgi:hypothetical protein
MYSNDYLAETEVYRKSYSQEDRTIEDRVVKRQNGYAVETRFLPLIEAVDEMWNDGWRIVFESASESECKSFIDDMPGWAN